MNTDKIALAMICKGTGQEVQNLKRCLSSVAPYVDAVYITLTGSKESLKDVEKVCGEFKVNVTYGDFKLTAAKEMTKWLKDFFGYEPHMKVGDKMFLFDEARNFSFSQVPKEYKWIFWMDTDDVLRNGENLWKLKEIGQQADIEAFYMNYLYQVELEQEEGVPPEKQKIKNIIIEHLRERLIRNEGKYKWIAPIHETLIEQVPTRKTDNYDCAVLHLATHEDRLSSLTRNLSNLELAIYQTQGKDPRHIYYLAKAFYDLMLTGQMEYGEKAIPLIQMYLYGEHKSGWPQERSQACEYLAEIYRRKNELNNAVKSAMNALIEAPENPSIFLNLATSYVLKKDYERALFWVKIASTIPEIKTTLVKNPRDLEGIKLEIIYNCALNLNKVDEAWAAAVKMKELIPNDPAVNQIFNWISGLREQRDVTKTWVGMVDYLKKTGEYSKLKPLLAATPRIAEETPFILDLKMKNNPPKFWDKDEIVIYCGQGFTTWSPKRLDDPREAFVGGSEEAVICMSKELQKQGWKVTVYGDPGQDEGKYDGVKWMPYYKFNILDNFNIVIAWRQPKFFTQAIKAKKKYVWCHDIQNPLDYDENVINSVDKFFFLSKWHRDNVPKLLEDKTWITSNGI